MKLSVIAMGRIKAPYARAGCDRFEKRLSRYAQLQHIEVKDVRRGRSKTVAGWKADEADALRKHVPKGAVTVLLDERGQQWTSQAFAQWLEIQRDRSVSHVAFVLGGPDGLDADFLTSAHRRWSLGHLTLPHELARLLVFEQLYRAHALMAGHPYHRE